MSAFFYAEKVRSVQSEVLRLAEEEDNKRRIHNFIMFWRSRRGDALCSASTVREKCERSEISFTIFSHYFIHNSKGHKEAGGERGAAGKFVASSTHYGRSSSPDLLLLLAASLACSRLPAGGTKTFESATPRMVCDL
jgi:hypothetical protein